MACGSAHSLAWSTNKPVSAGKLPTAIPMEYNHLQALPITTLRNRIVLLHHFSDLFCPSICMFDLQDHSGEKAEAASGLDRLRGVIVSSAKVTWNQCGSYMSRVMRKPDFTYAKTKAQISCAVTARLISTFVFATQIVQFLLYLYPKCQDSSFLLWMYRPVCVGPGQKP